jgi:hypothetical protein
MANYWRYKIISLVICFTHLSNHKICQVNFSKMLLTLYRNRFLMIRWFFDGCEEWCIDIQRMFFYKSKLRLSGLIIHLIQ